MIGKNTDRSRECAKLKIASLFLLYCYIVFFFNDTATTEIYTLSLHDALPILDSNSRLNILSGATFVLNNVELVSGSIFVESGGKMIVKNSKNSIWQNGNLTISGEYVLDNSTLHMNGTIDGEEGILVSSTGNMKIKGNSNITNGENVSFNYFFVVEDGAIFNMSNSYLSYVGWDSSPYKRGLEIYTDDAFIMGSSFENNYIGIILFGAREMILNNFIEGDSFGGNGAISSNSENNTIYNNTIFTYAFSSSGIYFSGPGKANNISSNKIVTSGENSFGIEIAYSSNENLIFNNEITTNGINANGIYVHENSNKNNVSFNFINSTSDGIRMIDQNSENIISHNIINSEGDRKSTRLNSSHIPLSRMPSSA